MTMVGKDLKLTHLRVTRSFSEAKHPAARFLVILY